MAQKKDKKDEFERIMQFLALGASEMSLNLNANELYFDAFTNMVNIIKSIDIKRQNGKNLAFMISAFGRNSLYDEVVFTLRDAIYEKFREGQANIYDIVECFNTLMTINSLTIDDLKNTGLDKNFEWAD